MKNEIATLLSHYSPSEQQTILAEIDLDHLRAGLVLNKALCSAVESSSLVSIGFLLDLGADPNEIALNERNALHIASTYGRIDVVQLLLDRGADIHIRNIWGESAFVMAIDRRYEDLALLLIDRGADIEREGESALEVAAFYGLNRVIKKLLELGVDLKKGNPLEYAAENGQLTTVKMLIEECRKVPGFQFSGLAYEKALYSAIKKNDVIADYLLNDPWEIRPEKLGDFLKLAVETGSIMLVERLLYQVFSTNQRECEANLLESAILFDHENLALYLIDQDADLKGAVGARALSSAAQQGHRHVVSTLIEKGVDVNTLESAPFPPPLFCAAKRDDLTLMKLLIEAGADIHLCDPALENNALNSALQGGAHQAALYLLELGVTPKFSKVSSPLFDACRHGFVDIAKKLIEMGADVNSKIVWAESSLTWALRSGNQELVSLLIASGADIWSLQEQRRSAVCVAIETGWKELFHPLIEKALPNLSQEQLTDLFVSAILGGDRDLVKKLIDQGVSINRNSSAYSLTPLWAALESDQDDIALLLLAKGADINVSRDGYISPLDAAISHYNGRLTKLLLDLGVQDEGSWLLFRAIGFGCLGCIERLIIDKKLDPNIEFVSGGRPLHYLIKSIGNAEFFEGWYGKGSHQNLIDEQIKIAEFLVKQGANPNVFNDKGLSPLHLAASEDHLELIETLLSLGADINLPSPVSGATPLHLATSERVVDLLIARGAHLEARDNEGLTPLHAAVQIPRVEAMLSLLEHGANIQTKALDGSTLRDAASPLRGLVEFLSRKGVSAS